MIPSAARLIEPSFWTQTLEDRMAEFAQIRELGAVLPIEVVNPLAGDVAETFYALPRFDEVVQVSKNPDKFCSGRGATSVFDLPMEMLEFFGGFINMDNPRHANQRRIVAYSFTPLELQGVLKSVESICTEVIDGFCEQGEVDLVEALSQPFPLLIICDMMGIPRSEFKTVLDATNVILSGGDPEFVGEGGGIEAFINAGMSLATLMGELIEERRINPTDDLTSKLVHNQLPEITTVHWHGLILPNQMDGPAYVTQAPIQPGGSYSYAFTAIQHGTYFYHPHAKPDRTQSLGLYGALIIDPADPAAEVKADHEYVVQLQEWLLREGLTFIGTNNNDIHPMHIHGGPFQVVAVDGETLAPAQRYMADTVLVGPGQRFDVVWLARRPGKWLIHCHIPHHTSNNNVETRGGGGLLAVIDVK